jgi:ribosomal protein L10
MFFSSCVAKPCWATRLNPRLQCRQFAMWAEEPRIYKNRSYPRAYNPKTTQLKDEYLTILSSKQPLLFLRHQDFKARDLIKLRSSIAAISSLLVAGEHTPVTSRLTGVRASVLGVAFRECEHLDNRTRRSIKKLMGKGAIFVLSLPILNPPHLMTLLRVLDRAVPSKRAAPSAEEVAKAKQEAEADFMPGKEQKRQRPVLVPQLELVGALIEGKAYEARDIREMAKLPPLQTLHSQIVGLISSPASQISGILSQASGGQLLRTLQGHQRALEDSPISPEPGVVQ